MTTEAKQDEQTQASEINEDKINEIVNRALTAREKRLQTALEKQIADSIAKLNTVKPADDTANGDTEKAKAPKESPEVKALAAKLAQMEARLKTSDELREKIERQARESSTRTRLRDALKAAGVKEDALEIAVGHIFDARKLVKFDDEGNPILMVSRSRAKGAAAEAMEFSDLAEGAKDWAKTQEAGFFLPAPTAVKLQAQQGKTTTLHSAPQAAPANGERFNERDAVSRTVEQLAAKGVDVLAALNNE